MTRVTFTDEDGSLRWFDDEAAQASIVEGRTWDGNNWLGVISGLQTDRACLYLTAGGRWIEHTDARREFTGQNRYRSLTGEQAREWLLRATTASHGSEDAQEALDEFFPDTPEESGQSVGGRPAIGPTISVAYPRKLLDRIDGAAEAAGMSRAEWLRRVAMRALAKDEAIQ